ncbi:MAG TPA: NAD-dependent epimerase [Flavobacteriales bacterium]|nr:NAD-dependent epimerase [Flavobacteriales bacterium]
MSDTRRILVIGCLGQVGSELTDALRENYGTENVIGSDVRQPENAEGPFEIIDVLDIDRIREVVDKYTVTEIYNLAALLSANAEKNIEFAWKLNMDGLFNTLNLAREGKIKRLFWPSSIAVFGPTTPKDNTPQDSIADPNTVYGISKLAGERWCEYYFNKFNVDVRSIRYPGLIGYKTLPGGGTTDYAVDIFHQALKQKKYTSFLGENSTLPMMYMPDAIRATIQIMNEPAENIKVRSSYNIAGISFSPSEIAGAIKKHIPEFEISYAPDFRQAIADSWPKKIDDSRARHDWNWSHEYDLEGMVKNMLENLG